MSEPALVRDTSSEKQTQRASRRVRDRVNDRRALTRRQLSTYDGRQFLWQLIGDCGVFEDMHGTNEVVREAIGQRRVGLRLMADCGQHPELFRQMQTEATERAARERRDSQAHAVTDTQEQQPPE